MAQISVIGYGKVGSRIDPRRRLARSTGSGQWFWAREKSRREEGRNAKGCFATLSFEDATRSMEKEDAYSVPSALTAGGLECYSNMSKRWKQTVNSSACQKAVTYGLKGAILVETEPAV